MGAGSHVLMPMLSIWSWVHRFYFSSTSLLQLLPYKHAWSNMNNLAFRIWRILPDSARISHDFLRRWPRGRRWGGGIYLHVPKTAGVSVSRALYGRPLRHFRAMDIRRICPGRFNGLLTFGVVRHPIDRLHSAYRFAKAGGTSEMVIMSPRMY